MIRPSFYVLSHIMMPYKAITAIEVGTHRGANAKELMVARPDMVLYCVDPFIADTESEKADIMRECHLAIRSFKNCVMIADYSKNAAKQFPDKFFDYVYIDADHEYPSVKEDLNLWWPKVKLGGMLAGHDFWYAGVKLAVKEFVETQKVNAMAVEFYTYAKDRSIDQEVAGMMDWWIIKDRINNIGSKYGVSSMQVDKQEV